MATLSVIGGGNMAQAIIRGGIEAGRLTPADVLVVEPDHAKRALLEGWGVSVSVDAADAEGDLLLAVKPQVFPEVASAIRGRVDGLLVMSIMAGVSSASIRASMGDVRVVRLMPNTPARVGRGITALSKGAGSLAGDLDRARAIFEAVGDVVDLDESLMDAFTGVAGSGPAYVFYLAEAMVQGALGVDLPASEADRIVRATIAGAAALLQEADESPGELRTMVTSKGGTTAAATGVLDERGVMDAVTSAIRAARDRGRELG